MIEEITDKVDIAKELGLLEEEYNQIVKYLGREPNYTELGIYSVMWSEHCSYKNSITWLKKLPKSGPHMLAEAGEENAGLVDIGDGLACAFKIESHNHPSAIEPYQGAATGVGGINRDIFTMGARPIAQLNSLRFGDPKLEKTRWIMEGVVRGIGDYGNAFGVPVVGGEVYFDECYNTNPLVNAMSVGIVKTDRVISAIAEGPGNPIFIVGSATGKDGIHGAAFASKDITEDSTEDLPAVQVGDPFQEKLLLEASLELSKTNAIVGMQDMGAAGIICSTSEMSAKGQVGMTINLDLVPTRQDNMTPFELLLSESQERMLVCVKKGHEQIVLDIFEKWDLNCVQIGEVTEGPSLIFTKDNKTVAEVPAESLVLGGGAPVYTREIREPKYFQEAQKFNIDDIEEPKDLKVVTEFIISSPSIASKSWVKEQYDSMVGTRNMATNYETEAGIINLKESDKALAVSVDCNGRYVHADPRKGCAIAVSEAARNIVCSGGTPSAVTNCLNFGNPYNPEVYWQFSNAIMGMADACEKFKTPVTGGNVSFYNQTSIENREEAVFPTPTIGMVGIVNDKSKIPHSTFTEQGHLIYVLGDLKNDIACSEYLYRYHDVKLSPAPYFDLDKEDQLHKSLLKLINSGVMSNLKDCSDGGLIVTLLEMSFSNDKGFNINNNVEIRNDAFLFGEGQGRVVCSIPQKNKDEFEKALNTMDLPYTNIGQTTSGEISVNNSDWGSIGHFKKIYEDVIPGFMD
ncbi:MAG: phosphoribosylformylglycinamidine synthase subunit PurL [Flavobacteriales bacterium]|nr:phosphoribosylformylglycinamidine synthase subunit PurL [Flavobacteriales bacterium]